MKFDRNKAFPYPVLRPYSDDYTDLEFQTTVDLRVGKSAITIALTYAISSEGIRKEISKGNAAYVAVISCRDTYSHHVVRSTAPSIEAKVAIGDLRGEVRVDSYVLVEKPIPKFSSAEINPEFGAKSFAFEPGQILAQDESQTFYVDRDLFKPITSVFELVKKDDLSDGEWTIGFDEDHVQIEVSPKMKEALDDARNLRANRVILINSLYFAAVAQAIQRLKDSPADCEGLKWAEVIERQAHNMSCDLKSHDSYLIAQRLMKYPLALLNGYVFRGGVS